jgi:trimethylamine:corrinoid methyltransferase-like protein
MNLMFPNKKPALVSSVIFEQMVEYAIKTILETGIGTSNNLLLEKAEKNGLIVRTGRIYPDRKMVMNAMDHVKSHRLPEDHAFGNYHNWFDNLVPRPNKNELVIRVNDRATYYTDYPDHSFRPLSRQDVINGTKLIHMLHKNSGIVGYSCGTPQESHELLKGFEQYIIGFRYNQMGGSTEVPSNAELLNIYFDIREIAEDGFNRHLPDVSIWSPSPMILDSDELNLFFQEGTLVNRVLIGSMPIMGLTGPVDPVGNFTLALAETLGGATILNVLFPQTACYIMPHPQAMDLNTGLISFGTVEHFRLELIKTELFRYLELPYAMVKDTLTSAQIPDLMCQADKMLQIVSSITHGTNAFSICPLSCDEGWSPVQCLLDAEYIQNAWSLHSPVEGENRAEEAYRNIQRSVKNKLLFGEMDDTLMNMFSNYQINGLFTRAFSYQKWNEMGKPSSLAKIPDQIDQLISAWDYVPPANKWHDIIAIYHKLCRRYGVNPADFEN